VLAVLETHGGLKLGAYDIYLNVAGGLKINEPAADTAAAAAIISSMSQTPLPPDRVFMGEIGLTGALRPISQAATRLKEAGKLGFSSAVLPKAGLDATASGVVSLHAVSNISDLIATIIGRKPGKQRLETE
jgi:DNA repair protein RadA/Sms